MVVYKLKEALLRLPPEGSNLKLTSVTRVSEGEVSVKKSKHASSSVDIDHAHEQHNNYEKGVVLWP